MWKSTVKVSAKMLALNVESKVTCCWSCKIHNFMLCTGSDAYMNICRFGACRLYGQVLGVVHPTVNRIIVSAQHSAMACETKWGVRMKVLGDKIGNNSNKRFSVGFSSPTHMLLLVLRHLDKIRVRRGRKSPNVHLLWFFSMLQRAQIESSPWANISCQTEFRFIMLNKMRHLKSNFHVTSNILSNQTVKLATA